MKQIFLAFALMVFSGCMSTKMVFSEKWNPKSPPSYVDYFDYYWFGFVGDPVVSIQKACVDQKPHAVQRVKTFEDGFLNFVTLGIYSPVTVKIWCGE